MSDGAKSHPGLRERVSRSLGRLRGDPIDWEIEATPGGVNLERDELAGPASTWTYLVNDTPFESTIIRLYRGVARHVRGAWGAGGRVSAARASNR